MVFLGRQDLLLETLLQEDKTNSLHLQEWVSNYVALFTVVIEIPVLQFFR
jgi:hypothetical protein